MERLSQLPNRWIEASPLLAKEGDRTEEKESVGNLSSVSAGIENEKNPPT
jgi:hypothetical protein